MEETTSESIRSKILEAGRLLKYCHNGYSDNSISEFAGSADHSTLHNSNRTFPHRSTRFFDQPRKHDRTIKGIPSERSLGDGVPKRTEADSANSLGHLINLLDGFRDSSTLASHASCVGNRPLKQQSPTANPIKLRNSTSPPPNAMSRKRRILAATLVRFLTILPQFFNLCIGKLITGSIFSELRQQDFDKVVGIIRLSDTSAEHDDQSAQMIALQESRSHSVVGGVVSTPTAAERILLSRSPESRTVFICCEDQSSRQSLMLEVCDHPLLFFSIFILCFRRNGTEYPHPVNLPNGERRGNFPVQATGEKVRRACGSPQGSAA